MANQPTTRFNVKQIEKRDSRIYNHSISSAKPYFNNASNKLSHTALHGEYKSKKIICIKESRKVEFDNSEANLSYPKFNRRVSKINDHRRLDTGGLSKKSIHHNVYLKEHYIQANCQFVVSELVDCSDFLVDPDVLVPWELVEQIRFFASESPQCPICLYPPNVPRISKCGHIYCWACILQYIEHDVHVDGVSCVRSRSKKCAICAEHIYPEDLRSLLVCMVQPIKTGDTLHLRLMRKKKGCTQVLTNDYWQNISENSLPLYLNSANSVGVFSKILRASFTDLLDLLMHEKSCLEALAAIEESCAPIYPFICQALGLVEARIVSTSDLSHTMSTTELQASSRQQRVSSFTKKRVDSQLVNLQTQSLVNDTLPKVKHASASEDCAYYFYQSADGQLIYLNSLNWRCLVEEAGGDSSLCPPFLSGTILQLDAYTMSTSQRKKHPYLNHLPLASTLWEAELDLKSPIVSKETLFKFEKVLSQRRAERRDRERLDRQHSRIAEEAQMRQAGLPVDTVLLSSAMYQISLPVEIPSFTESDPQLGVLIPISGAADVLPPSAPSFAEMLRSPKCSAATSVWPICKPASHFCDKNIDNVHVSPQEWNLGDMLESQLRLRKQKQNKKNSKAVPKIINN